MLSVRNDGGIRFPKKSTTGTLNCHGKTKNLLYPWLNNLTNNLIWCYRSYK